MEKIDYKVIAEVEGKRANNLLGLVRYVWPEIRARFSKEPEFIKSLSDLMERKGYPTKKYEINVDKERKR